MSHSLGHQLRRARLKRGLSLPDVAHHTRIPAERLNDLENDNYNNHGGLIYAKNFLRSYANYLDVDASLVLDRLQPPPLAGAKDYRYLLQNLGPWINKNRPNTTSNPSKNTTHNTFLTACMITGCVALLACSLMFANSILNTAPPNTETTLTTTTENQPSFQTNPSITILPAIPSDTAKQVSWATPTEPLNLPLHNISPAGSSPHELPTTPVKAIPVND